MPPCPALPLIEPGDGDGHLFVDVTGSSRLLGPPVDVAWRLGRRIRRDLGLAPIWSLATSKLVAKTATRLVKPLGEYIVEPGDEAAFLAPLPLFLVPGIEGGDLERLNDFNITRVCPGQRAHRRARCRPFWAAGGDDHPRPASRHRPLTRSPRGPAVCRRSSAAGNSAMTPTIVRRWRAACTGWWKRAGRQLRRQSLAARRIGLVLEHTDGVRRVRQTRARPATANDFSLFTHARRLLGPDLDPPGPAAAHDPGLRPPDLSAGPAPVVRTSERCKTDEKQDRLVAAMDRIRHRFGTDALAMGRTLAA